MERGMRRRDDEGESRPSAPFLLGPLWAWGTLLIDALRGVGTRVGISLGSSDASCNWEGVSVLVGRASWDLLRKPSFGM